MKCLPVLFFAFLTFAGFSQDSESLSFVMIGQQLWMTANLDVGTFANGEEIPHAKTEKEWKEAAKKQKPAWCYYNNNSSYGSKYGKLYNWYAVHDPRGLAPKGWHIPHDTEWSKLTFFLGGEELAGKILKSDEGWNSYGASPGNGYNSVGFNGLPGGGRGSKGEFGFLGYNALWWSLVDEDTDDSWYYFLSSDDTKVCRYSSFSRGVGYSLRCVKDKISETDKKLLSQKMARR